VLGAGSRCSPARLRAGTVAFVGGPRFNLSIRSEAEGRSRMVPPRAARGLCSHLRASSRYVQNVNVTNTVNVTNVTNVYNM